MKKIYLDKLRKNIFKTFLIWSFQNKNLNFDYSRKLTPKLDSRLLFEIQILILTTNLNLNPIQPKFVVGGEMPNAS